MRSNKRERQFSLLSLITCMANKILISINTWIIGLYCMWSFIRHMSHLKIPQIIMFSVTNRFNNSRMNKGFLNSMFSKIWKPTTISIVPTLFLVLKSCITQQESEKINSQFREVSCDMDLRLKENFGIYKTSLRQNLSLNFIVLEVWRR